MNQHQCKDFDVCGNMADPRFTMDFTDVEPGAFIHWCAKCGPFWSHIGEVLEDKISNEDGFAKKLEDAMDAAQPKVH